MRQGNGFTSIELITVLAIAGIIAASVAPSMARLVEQQRIQSAGSDFVRALMLTRTKAALSGTRVALTYKIKAWDSGWMVYPDYNHNGVREPDEPVLYEHAALDPNIRIYAGSSVKGYIAYNPSGSATQVGGGFFADTITFCPTRPDLKAVRITISIGGRSRSSLIDANTAPCKA